MLNIVPTGAVQSTGASLCRLRLTCLFCNERIAPGEPVIGYTHHREALPLFCCLACSLRAGITRVELAGTGGDAGRS